MRTLHRHNGRLVRGRRHRPRVHAGWKTGAIVPGEHARVTTSVFDLPTRDPARAGRRTAVQRCLARTRGGSSSLAVVWQAANGIKGRIAPLSDALHGRKGRTPSPFVFSAAERRASRVRPVAAVAVLDRRIGPPCRPGVTSRSPNWRMSAGTDNPTCSVPGMSGGAGTASAQRTAGRPEAASAPGCRVPRTPRHDERSLISQA